MGRLAVQSGNRVQRLRQKVGNIAYSSGVTTNLQVPQTDYLTSLDIIAKQTVTTTGTSPVVAGYGAFGPLSNVKVTVNGNRTPFSMPGYHADVFNRVWNHDYASGLTANAVTINSTLNWKNHVRIPMTVDPLSEMGAWYTGDTALLMNVGLGMNAATNVFSTVNSATIGGSWDVWAEKFNLPQPDEPGGWLNEISFYHEAILQGTYTLSNGTTNIVLPIDVDYQRIILIFYTGSNQDSTFMPADGLYTALDLVANEKFHLMDTLDEDTTRFEMYETYAQVLPAGSCAIDFMRLYNNRRDILPTDMDFAKRLLLKVTSGSSNNKVDVITETVTDSQFAERWIKSARAKAAAAKGGR